MTHLENQQALLLNADFRPVSALPLSRVSWDETVKAVLKGTVIVVEEYDTIIRSPGHEFGTGIKMKLPSVIALKNYQSMDRQVAFTRNGVFLRDRFRCAYCGHRFPKAQLTFDHVIPKSRGGRTNWKNIISCCGPCNLEKKARLPEECGMRLLFKPYAPTARQMNDICKHFQYPASQIHESWRPYIPVCDADPAKLTRVTRGNSTDLVFPLDMTDADYWNVELDAE